MASMKRSNVVLRAWREPAELNFAPKDHVDLGAAGALDFEAAAQLSGARFVVIRGALARLQRALTQFMLDLHVTEHGYEEVYVPYLVKSQALYRNRAAAQVRARSVPARWRRWAVSRRDRRVPVTNLFRDRILDAAQLPVRHVCHTPCFRSEAGSYGRDTRGMIRQHQFEKVEIVQIVAPQQSWQALDELTSHAEAVLQAARVAVSRDGAVRGRHRFCRGEDDRPGSLVTRPAALSRNFVVQQLPGFPGASHAGALSPPADARNRTTCIR